MSFVSGSVTRLTGRRECIRVGLTAFLDRHTPHPEHGEISQTENC
jgi:hypothetical protein